MHGLTPRPFFNVQGIIYYSDAVQDFTYLAGISSAATLRVYVKTAPVQLSFNDYLKRAEQTIEKSNEADTKATVGEVSLTSLL